MNTLMMMIMWIMMVDDDHDDEEEDDEIESTFDDNREKIEDYRRFFTHAGETRFPIFACRSLRKLGHFVNRLDGALSLTLEIV